MEPIPARKNRTSIMSSRSAQNPPPPSPGYTPTMPLASLYVVSGLPKRPQTWTLADPDAVQGLSHSEGAVGRWWRAEVLGSTVSPGVGGGKKKKVMKGHATQTEISKGPGALSKQETAKMLSKALKVRFFRAPLVPSCGLLTNTTAFIYSRSRNHRVHTTASVHSAYFHVHFTPFIDPACAPLHRRTFSHAQLRPLVFDRQ